jgi:hypothetical protein
MLDILLADRACPENYRIKPEEPKFKVGDWVRDLRDNSVFQINSVNFNSLIKIKEFFLSLMSDEIEENAEKEKEKRSRIELRIDEKQKREVLQKCKEININI